MQQNSPEWFAARCGKVTASRIADVVAKTKTGVSAMRVNYMAELLAERLTGLPVEGFKSEAMKWGSEVEPEARAAYEFYRNQTVAEVGFVLHPRMVSLAMTV
jgi:predicted phage-related endonuclease